MLLRRARRHGEQAELGTRRRLHFLIAIQSISFAVVVLTGFASMRAHGWTLAYPRWLALKIGLVAFLFVPIEAFLLYVGVFWIGSGLRATPAPPLAKELVRGASMQEMVWAIALPLLGLAVPLVIWLSRSRSF